MHAHDAARGDGARRRLLRHMRAREEARNTLIIALTGWEIGLVASLEYAPPFSPGLSTRLQVWHTF